MKTTKNILEYPFVIYHIGGWIIWTLLIICLAGINIRQERAQSMNLAINTARADLAKDKTFRLWGVSHGGVYVPTTNRTPPNPYLKHVPERDIVTPTGNKLTLMNPAYMLSQIMREYGGLYGSKGHITSLNVLNPKNAPDAWEIEQLKLFKKGETETYELISEKGTEYLRIMKPFITKKECLKCHANQGYAVGDVRGGISLTIPMLPFRELEYKTIRNVIISFCLLWVIGLFFISIFISRLQIVIKQRIEIQQISEKHELLAKHNEELKETHSKIEAQNKELKEALAKVKLLSGFIPICASCKKIRDDKGYWNQIELYIKEHSMAEFSHCICPECSKKLYPEFYNKKDK
ncbi:MAG: DUF3365 domain-containing protein [Desulfobulbaceae bacterium]|nr:DUF3365 domain-containing protein [Desulfobulbaceae bacterium]